MSDASPNDKTGASSAVQIVTLCSWSNTVEHDGEWMTFAVYLWRRFGLIATHGMSPQILDQLKREEQTLAGDALMDPERLAAVRSTGLLDHKPIVSFDRITRLGKSALSVPVAFISLVEDHRDFYLSHCGFGEPLASERQITGKTFCHINLQDDLPVIIPDTRADPKYASFPTVESLGVGAYLGAPIMLTSGHVIGSFCAIDFAPHVWNEEQIVSVMDLARVVAFEIQLRQTALDFQQQIGMANFNSAPA